MSTQTTNERLATALADLEKVIAVITSDQLDNPTQCKEFDVARYAELRPEMESR